jgi:hypothetical protein
LFLFRQQNVPDSTAIARATRIGVYVVVALRIETLLGGSKTARAHHYKRQKAYCIKAWVRYVHRIAHAAADQKDNI